MLLIRILDVILSLFGLIILAPILFIISIILLLTGEHKVFYLQERVGLNKITFKLIKFVTMLENSPNIGPGTITIKDDPRVLPFGKFLRVSKLNEVPQLINVLVGDISLIGPRPLTSEVFSFYNQEQQEIIASLKPGLSGIGSIMFRSEDQILDGLDDPKEYYNTVITPKKAAYEKWFKDNRGISLYLTLIICTLIVVVTKKHSFLYWIFKDLPKFDEITSTSYNRS
ncbi:sugar transferase [Amylibacter sp.]|nr:sugar transferase [Amylibacter sp.]